VNGQVICLNCCGVTLEGEFRWNLVANLCVTTDAIVEHLDVLEHDLLGLLTSLEAIVVQAFGFDRAKEAFHRRVVPAASFTTH